ncbi:MAG TPA: WGR domain-containing protein, partial [Kofleriaceae bacterium]
IDRDAETKRIGETAPTKEEVVEQVHDLTGTEAEAKPEAKKAATKKAAPKKPAAKPAAKSGGSAPRYFEFSEGTSNKFWEITMAGNAVKTRYGKIGTAGQQTLKEFGDAAATKKEYDKLIAEKTKKGYEEGEAGGGGDDDGDED